MSDPEGPNLSALEALVASNEFSAVRVAVDALDPMLLLDAKVGAHLQALRTGMANLEPALAAIAAAEAAAEPDPEDEPGEE